MATKQLLVRSLWLVAAAVAVHELEEWNIASWTARNFTNHTGVSDPAIWVGLVVITGTFTAWIYAATRLENPVAIAAVALPAVALVAAGNAVQHVTWAFLFSGYNPGVVSAVLLVLPASCYAMWRMVALSRFFLVPIAGCAALWIAASVQIVAAGHTMQPFQLVVQRLCIALATALGLPGASQGG
jgi:hypothetical protein